MSLLNSFSYLNDLEAESIFILREAAAEFARPAVLYSIGKDSSVLLRLPQKAFTRGALRFRSCTSDTLDKIVEDVANFRVSERQNRVIDHD